MKSHLYINYYVSLHETFDFINIFLGPFHIFIEKVKKIYPYSNIAIKYNHKNAQEWPKLLQCSGRISNLLATREL